MHSNHISENLREGNSLKLSEDEKILLGRESCRQPRLARLDFFSITLKHQWTCDDKGVSISGRFLLCLESMESLNVKI
jgi:hypothetical protein